MIMRPVGVGRRSRGTDGVDGLTMIAGRPSANHILNQPLGSDLATLIGADGLRFGKGRRFVCGRAILAQRKRGNTRRVDDALGAGATRRLHDHARSLHIRPHDLFRCGDQSR